MQYKGTIAKTWLARGETYLPVDCRFRVLALSKPTIRVDLVLSGLCHILIEL